MITKKQWKELCLEIRKKRLSEGKDIYFGFHKHNLHACFYKNSEAIEICLDRHDTIITHSNFIGKSYKEVKSFFHWIEIHDLDEKE